MLLYVTFKDKEEAKKIIKALLENKFIACGNIFPVESFYNWNGEVRENTEYTGILKTNNDKIKKAEELIKKMHSYDIPCIIKIKGEACKEFEDWANYELR